MKIRLDKMLNTAEIFGPGTYENRDNIKLLGNARWNASTKIWVVSPLTHSEEELERLFPGAEFEIVSSARTELTPNLKNQSKGEEAKPIAASPGSAPLAQPNGQLLDLKDSWSVSKLIVEVQRAISQYLPSRVCLYGRLNHVKRQQGRVFLELADDKDPDSYVNCVIWADESEVCRGLSAAGFQLEPDLQVMFLVEVQLSRKGARLSLRVVEVVAEYTIQKVSALREITNRRLREEGLFGLNKERQLTFLPRRLGILTSKTGTVIHDFRASLDEAHFGFELFWFPVSVQGQQAKDQLVKGLSYLQKIPRLDAILVFRGGGSPAELAVFNHYEVARAICLCPIPVISAIGHQEDQSSAQDVSWRAFGVPKDLGRFFADLVIERRMSFASNIERILRRVSEIRVLRQERLNRYVSSFCIIVEQIIRFREQVVLSYWSSICSQSKGLVSLMRSNLLRLIRGLGSSATNIMFRESQRMHRYSTSICGQSFARWEIMHLSLVKEGHILLIRIAEFICRLRSWLERRGAVIRELEILLLQAEERIDNWVNLMVQAGPETQLSRGFVLVRSAETKEILVSAESAKPTTMVELQFKDGIRGARIMKENYKENQEEEK